VEKHVFNYLMFKYKELPEDILSKYNCNFGLRRGGVDASDRRQYRLHVTAHTQDDLNSASDALAGMIVMLTEQKVIERKISLSPKECFAELESELKSKDVLLMASSCRLIGPAAAMDAAQSAVSAAVNKMYARQSSRWSSSVAATGNNQNRDIFTFHIPHVELGVHVRQGMHAYGND